MSGYGWEHFECGSLGRGYADFASAQDAYTWHRATCPLLKTRPPTDAAKVAALATRLVRQ